MKKTLITFGLQYEATIHRGYNLVTIAHKAIKEGRPITFDKRYFDPNHVPKQGETPILEIKHTPLSVPKKYAKILEPRKPFTGTLQDYGKLLKDAMKAHLSAVWDAKHPTIISHSAGYDSRIISHTLAEMRDEGFDLGPIHFRCHAPENEQFYRIMQKQGWDKSQYSGDEALPAMNHYDIGRTDIPANGWVSVFLHMNWWRDILPVEDEAKVNMVNGSGGGELFDYPTRGMKLFKHHDWCENDFINRYMNHFFYNHEWTASWANRFRNIIVPYFSHEYLDVAAECNDDFLRFVPTTGGKIDAVRHSVMMQFKNTTLDIEYGPGHVYLWDIPAGRIAEMTGFWNDCTFRKTFGLPTGLVPVRKDKNGWHLDTHESRMWQWAVTWQHIHAD